MRIKDAISYLVQHKPSIALPVHDAVLSDVGRAVHMRVIAAHIPPSVALHETANHTLYHLDTTTS